LNTGTINFAPGTAQISENSYDFLNRAAESLRNAPSNTVVEVVGHAESSANPAAATQLAQQRANAVREYLVGRGVAPERLVARAYADSGASSSGRAVTFSAAR
jgi:outer membrane protein OmpA-like peptidoglycan-associated protein